MTLAAWDAVREADRILAPDADDPTVDALRHSGFTVAVEPSPPLRPTDGTETLWIAPTGDLAWARRVADSLVTATGADSGADPSAGVEVVFGSYDLPGARLLDLVAVMDQLRVECPWTREQTHASLQQYLLEESYEVLDALDRGDTDELREELGDLLMQVVFHAAVAARPAEPEVDADGWDIDDVAAGIVEKLVRRNPHVFADGDATTPDEVDAAWQRLKATEKQRSSVLDGVPPTLPALAYADKVVGRLQRDGALTGTGGDSLGDRLLALVIEARASGEDPEAALRRTVNALVP
ncbi:hypothetical protein FE697_011445 [Mumia zhuanghuii]|nr:hypothetical protein FE697_011445 [Mumia zhuanghuii]